MRNADPRAYGTGGVWPLQHVGFKDKGWRIATRNAMLAYRINGRLQGAGDVGTWLEEKDTRGDVVGGNLWDQETGKRDLPGWAFAWPAVIVVHGGSQPNQGDPVPTFDVRKAIATGGGNGQPIEEPPPPNPVRRVQKATLMRALPIAAGNKPDVRFVPKNIIIPHIEGRAGKDPNAPPAPAPPPGQGQPGVLFLGIGASATAQGFGGSGVGTGSGFARFVGVRTNFSSGSANAGARFNQPREGGQQVFVGRQ